MPKVKRDDGAVEREYTYDQIVGMHAVDYGMPVHTNDDVRSLTFRTDRLSESVELTGTEAARLRIRPTTPEPIVAARVIDVAPDGATTLVTTGQHLLSRRDDVVDPRHAEPGTEYEVSPPLKPKSHVFEPDHRLGLSVNAG